MKKVIVEKIKRNICVCLIVALSLNSYAALVSSNDSSGFVTKSEFENLKRNISEQVDEYNGKVESKIDNAVELYLSRVYTADAIPLHIVDNKVEKITFYNELHPQWEAKIGRTSLKLFSHETRQQPSATTYCGDIVLNLEPKSALPGTYAFIDTETFTDSFAPNIACWKGVSENVLDTIVLFGAMQNTTDVFNTTWKDHAANVYAQFKLTGSMRNYNNFDWLGKGLAANPNHFFSFNIMDSQGGTSTDEVIPNVQGGFLSTDIGNTNDMKYKMLITNKECKIPRLRHISQQRWWQNDAEWNTTKVTSTFSEVFSSGKIDLRLMYDYWKNPSSNPLLYTGALIVAGRANNSNNIIVPYVGFVNNIASSSQIYNSQFDVVANYYKTTAWEPMLLKESDGTVHMPTWAGYPLGLVEAGKLYSFEFNFEDDSKTYDVAFKVDPFSNDYFINSNDDLMEIIGGISLVGKKYQKFNGKSKVSFRPKSSGYVFLKCTEDGNGGKGGGIMLPAANYDYIVER